MCYEDGCGLRQFYVYDGLFYVFRIFKSLIFHIWLLNSSVAVLNDWSLDFFQDDIGITFKVGKAKSN